MELWRNTKVVNSIHIDNYFSRTFFQNRPYITTDKFQDYKGFHEDIIKFKDIK